MHTLRLGAPLSHDWFPGKDALSEDGQSTDPSTMLRTRFPTELKKVKP
jgi:hypothetical protein